MNNHMKPDIPLGIRPFKRNDVVGSDAIEPPTIREARHCTAGKAASRLVEAGGV